MKNNLLYELKEVNNIADEGGESDSELCKNCRYTNYGEFPNQCQTNGEYYSCEGSVCDEAIANIEDNLMDEYKNRKGELSMKESKMNIEIDLSILENNIVKMSTDKIQENVVSQLIKKIESKIETQIQEKINEFISFKVKDISVSDIYNIKINLDFRW